MRLNELRDNPGAITTKKRVGRGIGSGKGKTAGRGHKGQKSRSGVSIKGFEGGQMPIHMRLPKRGFNRPKRARWAELNVGRLQRAIDAGKLDAKGEIDAERMQAAGLIRAGRDGVRLLGGGELKTKLQLVVTYASPAASKAVESAGGKIIIQAPVSPGTGDANTKKADQETPVKKSSTANAGSKPESKAKPQAKSDIIDDIALIGGVGPALKKKLTEAGLAGLADIAGMNAKQVQEIDESLGLKGRIEREEWVAQAKELLAGKPPRAKVDQVAKSKAKKTKTAAAKKSSSDD